MSAYESIYTQIQIYIYTHYMCTTYWTARVTAFEFSNTTLTIIEIESKLKSNTKYRYRNPIKIEKLCSGSKINYKQNKQKINERKKQTNIYIYYIHIYTLKTKNLIYEIIYIYIHIYNNNNKKIICKIK